MPDEPFTIERDGDDSEKRWWPRWTAERFPSYETFFVARVVPLTYRVKERWNIRFQTTEELEAVGYTDEDVAVAQLHYTLLLHPRARLRAPGRKRGRSHAPRSSRCSRRSGRTSSSSASPA